MRTIGDAGSWDDLFPTRFIPDILDLVVHTWERFEKPAQNIQEPPITRRFRTALKQAKDLKRLPFFIMREDAEDDFLTGEELGRKDLVFYPTRKSSREEVYFVFECKRINALVKGKTRPLTSEYVTEGMTRFATGQYAQFASHGGMIGYVLDGRCDHAIALIEENIRNRRVELRMDGPGSLATSRLRPNNHLIRETEHRLSRTFLLHHVFLACPVPVVLPQRTGHTKKRKGKNDG